jgi:hypothetical protein
LLVGAAALLWTGCSSGSNKATFAPTTTAAPSSTVNPTAAPAGQSTCSGPGGSNSGPESSPPGDIPDTQAFVTYQRPADGFSISVPEGWARSEQTGSVTFTDKFNSIRVDVTPAAAAPTAASAQAEVAALAPKVQCLQPASVSTVSRTAGNAVLVKYRADSRPDQVTGKVVHQDIERYEFWKGGSEAVVTLASPAGSDNVDPWHKVTDSFAWLR